MVLLALVTAADAVQFTGNPILDFRVDRPTDDYVQGSVTLATIRVHHCAGGYTDVSVGEAIDPVEVNSYGIPAGDHCSLTFYWATDLDIDGPSYTVRYAQGTTAVPLDTTIDPVALSPWTVQQVRGLEGGVGPAARRRVVGQLDPPGLPDREQQVGHQRVPRGVRPVGLGDVADQVRERRVTSLDVELGPGKESGDLAPDDPGDLVWRRQAADQQLGVHLVGPTGSLRVDDLDQAVLGERPKIVTHLAFGDAERGLELGAGRPAVDQEVAKDGRQPDPRHLGPDLAPPPPSSRHDPLRMDRG
jgi:hypothetical protein